MITPENEDFVIYVKSWVNGIKPELDFWSEWLRTKGLQWPEDYAYRMQQTPHFALEEHLNTTADWPPTVLDVGSGPISPVGINTSKGQVNLYACDPLALFYKKLFKQHDVSPYVIPEFAYVEALTDRYNSDFFDLVHMSNALDHSFMPIIGIANMLAVAKIGGAVVLRHAENEAEQERYSGFHQWNITEKNGDLIIWRKDEIINATQFFSDYASSSVTRIKGDRDTVIAVFKKHATHPSLSPNNFKNQFDCEILNSFVQDVDLQKQSEGETTILDSEI